MFILQDRYKLPLFDNVVWSKKGPVSSDFVGPITVVH